MLYLSYGNMDLFLGPTVKEQRIQALLAERCDGNRNIIQACVAMCTPQSNTENKESNDNALRKYYALILNNNFIGNNLFSPQCM